MIKITNTLRTRIILWSNLILFLVFIQYSCQKETKKSEVYFYKATDKDSRVNAYFKRVVFRENNKRTDTITRFNPEKQPERVRMEKFEYSGHKLTVAGKDYLIPKKDTCYSAINDRNNPEEICFLGYQNLRLENKKYEDCLAFKIEEQITDGFTVNKYYDEDYVLIREEFTEGPMFYYKIERVEAVEGL